MSHDYTKKDYYNHWLPKRTIDDVYDLVKNLSKTVADLKRELEIVKEQNVDALEMLNEGGDVNISIVADGYANPEDFEPTTLEDVIRGENFHSSVEFLFEVLEWLGRQMYLADDNGWHERKVGYKLTADYIRRLIITNYPE